MFNTEISLNNLLIFHSWGNKQNHPSVDCALNVMAHAQKAEFVFRRNGRVHLNRQGLQFSRLLAAEACAPAVVMLDTPSSEVVWRVMATHSIRQFPLHFPSRATTCAITFQLGSTTPAQNPYSFPFDWCSYWTCSQAMKLVQRQIISY